MTELIRAALSESAHFIGCAANDLREASTISGVWADSSAAQAYREELAIVDQCERAMNALADLERQIEDLTAASERQQAKIHRFIAEVALLKHKSEPESTESKIADCFIEVIC